MQGSGIVRPLPSQGYETRPRGGEIPPAQGRMAPRHDVLPVHIVSMRAGRVHLGRPSLAWRGLVPHTPNTIHTRQSVKNFDQEPT
ncbi:hypothetical protein Gain_0010_116 [Komagataeibacter intermedius TF2]|nr:hypothetical protein Gain_0010_116 [Komagataeibacter intermedius TF2]